MKKLGFILCLLAVLVGCASDNDSSQAASFGLPTGHYSWNASVTEQTVDLTATAGWTATSNVGWCSPWKASGTKDDDLVLWVSPNITTTARTGVLTVKSGGQTKEVTLEQPAYTDNLDDYQYKLPVVFHVLYKNQSDSCQYVRKGRLEEIIKKVNTLYSDNDIKVQFEMAKYDEDGEVLAEPGVIRHQVDFDEFDSEVFLSNDPSTEEYATYGQNYKKFINLYVFKFKQMEDDIFRMGLTSMPLMSSKYPLEGLHTQNGLEMYSHVNCPWGCCINNEYIYEESGQYYNPQDVVVTVAHELGHYLGLLHPFSSEGCADEDYCDDTPSSDYDNYIAWVDEYVKEKGDGASFTLKELATRQECHTDTAFVADNVMDYAYCYSDVLTKDQAARMRYVLHYCAIVNGPKLVDYLSATNGPTRSTVDRRKLPMVHSGCPGSPLLPDTKVRKKY